MGGGRPPWAAVAGGLLVAIGLSAGCSHRPLPIGGGRDGAAGAAPADAAVLGDVGPDRPASGSGGIAAGGAGGAGGGAAGAGGTGGVAPECLVPARPVPCSPWLPSLYFDAQAGHCRSFEVGACGGNINQFDTLARCESACLPALFTCRNENDCDLALPGCCGPSTCVGPLDLTSYIAVNRASLAFQQKDACPFPHYCGGGEPGPSDPLDFACQYAIATCEQGRCRTTDLRQTSLVACQTDGDCRLRQGSRCCPTACDVPLIAINSEGDFDRIVCPAGPCAVACPPPVGYGAACRGGRCTVVHSAP